MIFYVPVFPDMIKKVDSSIDVDLLGCNAMWICRQDTNSLEKHTASILSTTISLSCILISTIDLLIPLYVVVRPTHLSDSYANKSWINIETIIYMNYLSVVGVGQCELWGTAPPQLGPQHTPHRQLPLLHGQSGG